MRQPFQHANRVVPKRNQVAEYPIDINASVGFNVRQNGVKRFSGIKTTRAPSGSFTVHKLLDNKAGKDRIVGKATALSNGQTCRGALRI